MLWRVAARTYIDTRKKLAAMGEEEFLAYHEKWRPKARKALAEAEYRHAYNLAAKWEGFNDALGDAYTARYTADDVDEGWVAAAMQYLYEEAETP